MSNITKPMYLGNVKISGRVIKTATAETMATDDGFVTDELLAFYEPIVDAGTPLIISGNLYVSLGGKSSQKMTGADHPSKIPGLSRLVSLAHQKGGKIFAQINHCGRQVIPAAMDLDVAVSASPVTEKLMGTKPQQLDEDQIKNIIKSFADSAEHCVAAGFDGLQLHGGHGYLINQFLTPYTNRRSDAWGGSFSGRMRFLLELYRAVRKRVKDDFPIIVKLNGEDYLFGRKGLCLNEMIEIARILQEEGVDGIEVTVGHYESIFPMIRGRFDTYLKDFMEEGFGGQLPMSRRLAMKYLRHPLGFILNRTRKHSEGFNLRYAAKFKEALTIPIICVGGFKTLPAVEEALELKQCDAVSIGRAMIADPYLYRNFLDRTEGPSCNFCNGCIARWGSMPLDCYDDQICKEKDITLALRKES